MAASEDSRPIHHRLSRSTLAVAALGYTAFAIYGSWVPLNFRPIPFDAARARFAQIQWLDLGIGHRADWVANILLFIPLAFLWLGALWPRSLPARLAASLLVCAAGAALAVAIEFSQVYFPGRTVSLNDVAAETIGAAAGVLVWWMAGSRLSTWVAELRGVARPLSAVERGLTAYAAIAFLYALLPLDLTISGTEIYRKFMRGGINLVPFVFYEKHASYSVYSMLSEVVIWVPIGTFIAMRWPSTTAASVVRVAAASGFVELLQVFIHSRTTDVNDVIAASAGGAIGAMVARRFRLATRDAAPAHTLPSGPSGLLVTSALVLVWAAGAAFVFLFPFDFHLSGEFIRGRLEGVPRVLFASYYWGSEYNAVTQVMRKFLYFLPLGAVLAWGFAAVASPFGRALYGLSSAVLVVAAAAGIEVAQLALPGKIVDATDAVLSTLGALTGWACAAWTIRLSRGRS